MDPGRQAEFLIEGRFELRQSLFSTEGLRPGDKDDLVSLFFRSGDDLLYGLGRNGRNRSSQSERQPEYRHADESEARSVHLQLRRIDLILARYQANDFVFRGISDDAHRILSPLHRFDALLE